MDEEEGQDIIEEETIKNEEKGDNNGQEWENVNNGKKMENPKANKEKEHKMRNEDYYYIEELKRRKNQNVQKI